MTYPKILVLDIETAPIEAYVWGLYDQNLTTSNIKKDWSVLAWAAKWCGDPASKAIYADNRKSRDVKDDKGLLKKLAVLLNKADVIITQNGEKFDFKKIHARMIFHRIPQEKPYRSIDLYKESKKVAGFTSHSLEYMANTLNEKYKKSKHKNYPGMELWKAVLNRDQKAWDEMKTYNIIDVLVTDELYSIFKGWIKLPNLAVYFNDLKMRCRCGSADLKPRGYANTDTGKFRIYNCNDCGKWPRSPVNLLPKEVRQMQLKEGLK